MRHSAGHMWLGPVLCIVSQSEANAASVGSRLEHAAASDDFNLAFRRRPPKTPKLACSHSWNGHIVILFVSSNDDGRCHYLDTM